MDKAIRNRLEQWIDAHFDELLSDIAELVRIPSVATYDDPDTTYGPDCLRALRHMLALAEKYGFQTQSCDERCGIMTARPGTETIDIWCHLDVVPAGGDWLLTKPFEPVIREDYLIGRGADDNKGPALGMLYVLRALEALEIPTRHGLRLCVGTDEEHGMSDVKFFAEHCPASKLSVIADSGFPVCYGEKGMIEAEIVSDVPLERVTALDAGIAANMIPGLAEMVLTGSAAVTGEWVASSTEGERTRLTARGLSRHAAFPEGSVNAIHELTAAALRCGLLSESDARVLGFYTRVNDDWLGTVLGIAGSDAISGPTTCAGTLLRLREDGRAALHVNVRYCIKADSEWLIRAMESACRTNGCSLEVMSVSAPNYFPREDPLVDAMTSVYNQLTGEHREPFVMGGGTYARKLPRAFAFGLGGMDRPETALFAPGHGGAHQPDEGLYLPNFKKALLIFAMALLEADGVMA